MCQNKKLFVIYTILQMFNVYLILAKTQPQKHNIIHCKMQKKVWRLYVDQIKIN